MRKIKLFLSLAGLYIIPVKSFAATPMLFSKESHMVWMMIASLLVLFMTIPGISLFYGGMVQRKNVLSIYAQCVAISAIVSIFWVLFGYDIIFEQSSLSILHVRFFQPMQLDASHMINLVYQMGFAIISVAIIIGAFAERMKFSASIIFAPLWLLVVYCPIAHWVWGHGWLQKLGILDFAGGLVVHINSGVAGLIAAFMVGERQTKHSNPHDLSLVVIGTSILWIGWFGFNGGSAHSVSTATLALLNTELTPAAAALSWMTAEWIHRGKPSARGLLFGVIAGLVAITPACGYCSPIAAIFLGIVAGIIGYGATYLKNIFHYDDALDAFGIHGIAGILGSLLTAVVILKVFGGIGLAPGITFIGQLSLQVLGVLVVLIWSGLCTFIILWLLKKTIGLRVAPQAEIEGLDYHQHGEIIEG